MRLDKLLVIMKYGTRREVQIAIKNKLVTVNNEVVRQANIQVDPLKDIIIFNDHKIEYKENLTLIFNKPKNTICSHDNSLYRSVFDYLEEPYNRYSLQIAGRLDVDTTGLVILTTDGTLLHNIISPKKEVYKKYLVTVDSVFNNPKVLEKPMEILDGRDLPFTTKESFVEQIDETHFYLSIQEGKFHQVKRMVEKFNHKVVELKRLSIGKIALEDLEEGQYIEIELKKDDL